MNITRISLIAVLAVALPSGARAVDLSTLERTPIQESGRKKPYKTFTTETLQSLSGKTSLKFGEERQQADQIVTSMWLEPQKWPSQPVILVNYRPLKQELGLALDLKWFSYVELARLPRLDELLREVQALGQQKPAPKLEGVQKEVRDLGLRLALFEALMNGSAFAFVPHPTLAEGRWEPPTKAPELYPNATGLAVKEHFETMRTAFVQGDGGEFSEAAKEFSRNLAVLNPELYPSARLMAIEHVYQELHPFRWAWILYGAAAIVLWLTTLWKRGLGYRVAWLLVTAGFAMQLIGFTIRTIISGRAPVTNMYETVIWLAFGVILFALILEAIHRCRYYLLGATPVAVVSLILADTQPTILNSAIHPLVPVLRDNFWLSTHVTSITLSYAAFALALGVAHIILGKIIFGKQSSAPLYNYLYRSLQIGVLLLAIGTILGGVWANYSWGRFWDWDPKETWALIALLGYLLVLHGRIAGWWGGFGLAVGSVVGFQSVLMAWYGVNFVLGAGLHSYGFGTGGFPYVAGFTAAELLFVVVACVRKARGKTKSTVDDAAPAVA